MKTNGGKTATVLVCWLAVSLALAYSSPSAADQLDASRERLEKLHQQIESTLAGLRGKETESGELTDDLEQLNAEVRRIETLEKKSREQLAALTTQLKEKRQALAMIADSRERTERQLHARLVVLYKTGEIGLIRALLVDTESPRDMATKYAFLSRMVRHDRGLLNDYRAQIQAHQAALEELEALEQQQSAVVKRRSREQEALQKARKGKQRLLAEVKKDAELLAQMLQELRTKARRLNELVKRLESQETQSYTESPGGLRPQKGRLLWPVSGPLRVGFGPRRHGELGTLIESHGFEIEAVSGSPVIASAAGKVIFANSLRGYGKLMIIDHGDKYYTLYAHVARFTKQVGESATAAEVIAYSGYDGRDAVYFEIRQGGKPLDPGDWLTPR